MIQAAGKHDTDHTVIHSCILQDSYQHSSGIIRNNLALHSDNNDPFADAGITLEDSADTHVENHRIWSGQAYPNDNEATLSDNRTNASHEDTLEGLR